MSQAAAVAHAPPTGREALGVTPGKLAMWLFLGSDGMSFMGLIASYVALRYFNRDRWPDPPQVFSINLIALNTFVLISSSVTMVFAFAASQRRDPGGIKKWLALTMLGGLIFLGIQAYEYNELMHKGVKLWDNAGRPLAEWGELAKTIFVEGGKTTLFSGTFYVCTCFHGFHVLSGVIYIGSVLAVLMIKGTWTVNRIEILGLYWHFVDLVWIVLFTIIYLF